jgi:hypothetical protein
LFYMLTLDMPFKQLLSLYTSIVSMTIFSFLAL